MASVGGCGMKTTAHWVGVVYLNVFGMGDVNSAQIYSMCVEMMS